MLTNDVCLGSGIDGCIYNITTLRRALINSPQPFNTPPSF